MSQAFQRFKISRRAVIFGAAAAGIAAPLKAAQSLNIVATTGMIADVARVIGGTRVTVQALMGAGVDPHAYRQTRSDIVAMTRADVVLWHGLYLEAQMEDFFADLSARTRVVAVAEALPREALRANEDYADRYDPHVWMDPDLFAGVAETIAAVLSAARPQDAEYFAANLAAYRAQLRMLSDYAQTTLAGVPEAQRVLLTAHDAFGYFGDAYGFEVIGIQGISTESEAGLNRITALVDLIVARELRAVFVESSVSDRNIRGLIEGAAARGHAVRIGGELFSDAMGPAGTYKGTYVGMIDHNITTIARALGADVPATGMAGQLRAQES